MYYISDRINYTLEFTLTLITLYIAKAFWNGITDPQNFREGLVYENQTYKQPNIESDSEAPYKNLRSLNEVDLLAINADQKLKHKYKTAMSMIGSLPQLD